MSTTKPFYHIQNPDEALEAYLSGHDNLYGRMQSRTNQVMIESFLKDLSGKNVLEVGGAGGIWTRYFIDKGARVTCADISEPILLANKERNPEAECVLGDATSVRLNKKYDFIFAKDINESPWAYAHGIISNRASLVQNLPLPAYGCTV